jgi:single-strand DNA-binding protein
MKDVNKVILVGRLGSNPIQRETKKGYAVVHFPLATSKRFREETETAGESYSEETQWHKIVVWGKQAEACAQFLRKGNPVYIEGMVRTHKYEGKDGSSRVAFEIHAENVSFLGGVSRSYEGTDATEETDKTATA